MIIVEPLVDWQESDYMAKISVKYPNGDVWIYLLAFPGKSLFEKWLARARYVPGCAATYCKIHAIRSEKMVLEKELT